jgi:hypothetical protein
MLHFDLSQRQIYRIFDEMTFSYVIDLVRADERVHARIRSYFFARKVQVLRVVESFLDDDWLVQIKAREAFGDQYMKHNVSELFRRIFEHLVEGKVSQSPRFSQTKSYSLASDIADTVLDVVFGKGLSHRISPDLKEYQDVEIWKAAISFRMGVVPRASRLYETLSEISARKDKKEIYFSQTYITTNDELRLRLAKNTLDMVDHALGVYPDISVEYIQFFIMNSGNATIFPVGERLASRLHVIEVSNEQLEKLQTILQIPKRVIPEYIFRNIGARLSRGKLIMTGSQDTWPSPALYEIAQRELVGPLTIYKPRRSPADPEKQHALYANRSGSPYCSLGRAGSATFRANFGSARGPVGDMQGGSREQVFALNGWPWGRFVFRADTAFLMDQRAFKVPGYEMLTRFSAHQDHKYVSRATPPYVIRADYCRGIPSKLTVEGFRPDWGIWYRYVDGKGTSITVGYRIVPVKKEPPYVSRFELIGPLRVGGYIHI